MGRRLVSFPLALGADGNFYGTTNTGGSEVTSAGTIFKITPAGKLAVLHMFQGTDGGGNGAGVILGSDGNLYGVSGLGSLSSVTIFKITPQGVFTVLYSFTQTTGWAPTAVLTQHTNGLFYGESNTEMYKIDTGLAPFVRFVMSLGRVGKTVQILGQGFANTSGVSFNGTPATFQVEANTYLTAVVPSGATSGYVTVTSPSGVFTSNIPFHVIH